MDSRMWRAVIVAALALSGMIAAAMWSLSDPWVRQALWCGSEFIKSGICK